MKRTINNTKLLKFSAREAILDSYIVPCCGDRCADRIPFIVVEQSRITYHEKTEQEKTTYLIAMLGNLWNQQEDIFKYFFNGTAVCQGAFKIAYGVSSKKLYNVMMHIRHGNKVIIHGNSLYGVNHNTKKLLVVAYFNLISEVWGDVQPDIPEIHLPHIVSKKDVYEDSNIQLISTNNTLTFNVNIL